MIFEGFCSGSLESYQLYLSLWLINYCKIEIGKAFCYQLYSGPTGACLDPVLKISDPILGMTVICSESYLVNREIG